MGADTDHGVLRLGVNRYCVSNIWSGGWAAIDKMDVKVVRKNAVERHKRKRKLMKYIVGQVKEMKEQASSIVVAEMETVQPAPCTSFVHSLRPDVYKC